MLVITNQTVGNAEGEIIAFQFSKAEFGVDEKDGSRVITVETPCGSYVLRSLEDKEQIVEELKRLAIASQRGDSYDDKNVYYQLPE